MKIVRQPFLSDRLHVKELTRDSPSLACVYLNEYGMAVAAFTLQCPEAKVLKVNFYTLSKAFMCYIYVHLCNTCNPYKISFIDI